MRYEAEGNGRSRQRCLFRFEELRGGTVEVVFVMLISFLLSRRV